MRCGKAKKLLITYMMDELEGDKREKLEEHLAECSHCANELEALKETWDLLDAPEEMDVPDHLAGRIQQQIAGLTDIQVGNRGRRPALQWSLIGAGLAVACCILALLLISPPITPEMKLQAGEIKIGFYLAEHERATQYVSFQTVSSTPSTPRWVPMNREDMFYYDGSEGGDSGLFLRNQAGQGSSSGDENAKPRITEGEIITLSEAQKLMPFPVIAPEVLGENYELELVLRIKGKDCVQLVYSDGAHTLSLFQQPLWTKDGIRRRDFQEYVLHKAKEGTRNAVLGWLTKEIAFNFVGEAGFSELVQLAEEMQEKIATDGLQNFYEELYGK